MPRFLAITVAKLCSAILEVRLASYRLDGNILSCTVNIHSYNTMEANGNTGVIPTTGYLISKCSILNGSEGKKDQ